MPPKRAPPPLSSSTPSQLNKELKGKQTLMDEWSTLTLPELENQQPAAGVVGSKSNSSSLTSAPESTQVPIINENNNEVANNSATVIALLTDDTQEEPRA